MQGFLVSSAFLMGAGGVLAFWGALAALQEEQDIFALLLALLGGGALLFCYRLSPSGARGE